jgi:biopolymer transport protein ExbB
MLDQLKTGDVFLFPLGLTALAALLLTLERFWSLFLRNDRGQKLAYAVLADLRQGRIQAALERCRAKQGTVAHVLRACLERAEQGSKAMEDAIQHQILHEIPRLRRFVRSLAILATIAPMLGLLGTVTGIIQTFAVIEAVGNTDPSMMAGGISLALMATLVGLAIAIPTLLVVGLFRGRGDRLLGDAERYSAAVLVLLSHGDPNRVRETSIAEAPTAGVFATS